VTVYRVVRANLTTVIASEARQSRKRRVKNWIASSFFMHHLFQKPLHTFWDDAKISSQ
jgi:hypothetical protein